MIEGTTTLPIKDQGTGGSRTGFVLGRRASLVVSTGVAGHTLWASAAPALTYRLYAQEWHLTHTATTAIFAVFPIAVVAMLVGFGGISDQIGRRATMLLGLGASLAGAVLFAVALGICRPRLYGRRHRSIDKYFNRGHSGVQQSSRRQARGVTYDDGASRGFCCRLARRRCADRVWSLAHAPLLLGACRRVGLTIATWFLPRHTAGEAKAD